MGSKLKDAVRRGVEDGFAGAQVLRAEILNNDGA
jgi:hypothetical protein